MNLLLYGGTFDPPHNGHLHNLQAVAAAVQPDLVVLMPAGVPPHKAASATPAALRLEMCEAFRTLERSGAVPALQISDWEIRRAEAGHRNYTVSTLQMLAQQYPDARLHLAVGSDMLLTFTTWFHWEEILQMAVLVCQSRETGDAAELEQAARQLRAVPGAKGVVITRAEAQPLASSEVRAALTAGQDCSHLLPDEVNRIIAREGLYAPAHGERGAQ